MLESCGEADLSLEPVGSEAGCEFRMENLERDRPVVLEIVREEHRGHPAAPKLTPERVVACQAAFEENSKVWHRSQPRCEELTLQATARRLPEVVQVPTGSYYVFDAMSQIRYLIIADGDFGPMSSKTANAIIRFQPERVVAVMDRRFAGQTVESALGFGGAIPIVDSVRHGLAMGANTVLVGIAPVGGRLPDEWRSWLAEALDAGCDLVSGLHTFLSDDPLLAGKAKAAGRQIFDLRRPPADLPVASGLVKKVEAYVVLTVGTDCNVGKMTAQLELTRELNARGVRTRFVATGQTGIMLEGWGIAVDAVIADFIAGAAERITLEGAREADVVLVEGQGSINHPGYSGVTLGLLHGACPDGLILCHQTTREYIGDLDEADWLRMPPLSEYIKIYEAVGSLVHPTRVLGICLNTYDLPEAAALRACEAAAQETGLPVTDPVRFDPAPLVNAVLQGRVAKQGRQAATRP